MRRDPEHRRVLALFADLLDYPVPGLVDKAVECEALLDSAAPDAAALLHDFRSFAGETPIGKLEEVYSGFFDLNPICHPYVGYQLFGENYKRSSLLLGLMDRYRAEGFQATPNEIPDRLSIVLRYIAQNQGDKDTDELVCEAVLPALERMTTKPESGHNDQDAHPAEFDGDTGVEIKHSDGETGEDRNQLAGNSHGEMLAGGFVLEMGSDDRDAEAGVKRAHPYYQVLGALRLVLQSTWRV